MAGSFVYAFSRTGFLKLRKTQLSDPLSLCMFHDAFALISTASSGQSLLYCGFGWKAMRTRPFRDFSHTIIRSRARFFTACVR